MDMSTIRGVWLEELLDSSKIKWLLISFESDWRNIRSITEWVPLELLAYWVGTWLTGKKSFRLKELATSMKTLL